MCIQLTFATRPADVTVYCLNVACRSSSVPRPQNNLVDASVIMSSQHESADVHLISNTDIGDTLAHFLHNPCSITAENSGVCRDKSADLADYPINGVESSRVDFNLDLPRARFVDVGKPDDEIAVRFVEEKSFLFSGHLSGWSGGKYTAANWNAESVNHCWCYILYLDDRSLPLLPGVDHVYTMYNVLANMNLVLRLALRSGHNGRAALFGCADRLRIVRLVRKLAP